MNIEQSICNAIQIIVEKYLKDAEFDKTVEANIIECIDEKKGQYLIDYQGNKIYAYAASAIFYEPGARVYVLISNNNLTKTKLIIGQVHNIDFEKAISENEALKEAIDKFITEYLEQEGFEDIIKEIVQKSVDTKYDKTYDGEIITINSNNTYNVKIGTKTYINIPTIGGDCIIGEIVKVMMPQNSATEMFIIKGGNGGSAQNVTTDNIIQGTNVFIIDGNF